MKIIMLAVLWIYRRPIGRFLRAGSRFVGDYISRASAEREAEKEKEQDYAGPHGGFDSF